MTQYLQLLRNNPGFAWLWSAQVVSLLGDWFNTIVLSALVAEYSDGSGLAVSGFLLARFLPPLLISPLAGVLVDRFDRKRLLILSDLLRAVVVFMFLIVVLGGPSTLWLLYVLTVFQFALSSIFDPGRNALMPSLLRREDLVLANTLGSVTWSVMLAVGAIAGGVVALIFGTAIALVIDGLSFVLSAFLITRIRLNPAALPLDDQPGKTSERTFMEGLRYVRARPDLLWTLLVKLGQSLGNVDALIIVYAKEIFAMPNGDSTTPLSMMFAAFGFGAVLGPLVLNRFNDNTVRTMRRLIIVGYVWVTLGWVFFGSASTLPLVLVALVLRAMGGSANWTYSSVLIQKCTPDSYLGRMFSLDMAGFQFASVVSTIITGLLVDLIGAGNVRQIVIIMAFISLVPLGLWAWAVYAMERPKPVNVGVGG